MAEVEPQSRFKKSAKNASELAKDEAILHKHSTVSSLHMLIGLFRENGEAFEILRGEGVTLADLRREAYKHDVRFATKVENPGYASRVIKSFGYALKEAMNDADEENPKRVKVDTNHLLRGLLRDSGGTAAHALLKLGVAPRELYSKLIAQTVPETAEV